MGIKSSDNNYEFGITDYQLYLFNNGTNYHCHDMHGASIMNDKGRHFVRFVLWAPNAKSVSVVGSFNNWDIEANPMSKIGSSGVWQCFVENVPSGSLYKYSVENCNGDIVLKADPYAFYSEIRPDTASVVWDINGYQWRDQAWIETHAANSIYDKPIAIYEVHLGSWQRHVDGSFLSYKELAALIIPYIKDMGYTHIELMPVSEHPFDGSWGYQTTGYYSVTSRYGTPQDLMYFIDECHLAGIGVILDWVPAHFPKDSHGLARFDGTALYEHVDPRQGEHPDWGTLIFNYGRSEVLCFLISNAIFLLEKYHVDGLRVDAVASMIYLDYGKKSGEWLPNAYGGKENIEAIEFLRHLNEAVFKYFPGTLMIAEESTAWPMVTMPTYLGGLGFNYKWNMGWMNDILKYMSMDPIHRKWYHNTLTFSLTYAFSENYILPLSHDEVVHGKKSLLDKMPGDYWSKFANLRLLYAFMIAHPGKKLLFMGGEIAQFAEWNFDKGLDWNLIDFEMHRKFHYFVKELNHFYTRSHAFWENDHSWEGFEWIDNTDYNNSVISFIRKSRQIDDRLIVVCNFTPIIRRDYLIGVPFSGRFVEVFNSDNKEYGGSGQINLIFNSQDLPWHSYKYSLRLTLPPLGVIFIKRSETN